jgi:ribosomal protein L10
MPAASKVAVVEEMTAVFKDAKAIYLADCTGLDVPRVTELRKKLYSQNVAFHVAKNRLARIAFRNAGLEGLDGALVGPTGFVVVRGDVVAPAKILADFARDAEGKPKVKLGFVDGHVYVAEQVAALAALPPRDVLLAQVVCAVQSPITGLVFTLQAVLRSLVGTLAALAQKRQAEGQGPA